MYLYVYVCGVLSCFSCVQLFVTLWTVARQARLSTGFSRQGYWSGLPCPPPGDLLNPGIEHRSLVSPVLVGRFFTTSTTREAVPGAQLLKCMSLSLHMMLLLYIYIYNICTYIYICNFLFPL